MTFEQGFEGRGGGKQTEIWGKSIQAGGTAHSKADLEPGVRDPRLAGWPWARLS